MIHPRASKASTGRTAAGWTLVARRENLVPGAALLLLTAASWAYTVQQGRAMDEMGMTGQMDSRFAFFLVAWAVMMVAMMLPAALPLMLLYRTITRERAGRPRAWSGMAALLTGYVVLWTAAGLPVYAYQWVIGHVSAGAGTGAGLLLIAGGVYQFTRLKRGCHTRCSNPLFFLMRHWRPGTRGALRLGLLHAADCIGCCAGLMVALVALGAMNMAWMLTAAVIIFMEKSLPGGHRVARPLGVALIAGGLAMLATPWLGSVR
jgi:predicted metal-binding membrane protein